MMETVTVHWTVLRFHPEMIYWFWKRSIDAEVPCDTRLSAK